MQTSLEITGWRGLKGTAESPDRPLRTMGWASFHSSAFTSWGEAVGNKAMCRAK